MNDVSFFVDHNVSVVSVLDLQQKTDDRVRSHRLDEVLARRLELLGCLVAVLVLEVGEQTFVGLATNLIARLCVRNTLDNSTLQQKGPITNRRHYNKVYLNETDSYTSEVSVSPSKIHSIT